MYLYLKGGRWDWVCMLLWGRKCEKCGRVGRRENGKCVVKKTDGYFGYIGCF